MMTSTTFNYPTAQSAQSKQATPKKKRHFDLLFPLRRWLDEIEITDNRFAHFICKLIPCSCPFERNVNFLGRTIHIPAFCKINPLYNEIMALRFRALSYLSDVCGEDIDRYIC
ncbi:Mo-dependent nitrogenase C-terminal domain-containing protein [Oscillatoria salina]|uniref:Mo-dependent nitrogenase C-terminal domain-containing protein n=1 Tax=Oscillatoria salina TaxID=331517 RepID=UPI001CCF24F9|nr:Mo-dependent nitrogenase C-terminal domain-containing protein [Oscillatoria salina]